MDQAVDVAVVGGGLAGLTAARELGRRGRSVVLLEGRDRLGGRAWVSSFAGVDVEMGGAFVHWTQPHLWAEVTRYGLGIFELPEADRALLRRDDGIEELDEKASVDLNEAFERLCAGTEAYLAEPMSIPEGAAAVEADLVTTAERIAALDLEPRTRDLLDGLCAGLSSAPNDQVGFLTIAQSFALAGFVGQMVLDTNGRWVARGRNRLAGRRDAPRPARGRAPRHAGRGDRAGRDGRDRAHDGRRARGLRGDRRGPRQRARRHPLRPGALGTETRGRGGGAREPRRQGVGQGRPRLSVDVRGGAGSLPLVVRRDGRAHAGRGTVVVGFGPSAALLSPDDPEPVARAIEDMVPGARVEEVGGHDWVRDPLVGETWASYGPGTSLRWLPELERREGLVAFAGGDFARGWGSYMDGAIETGLRASREVEAILS